MFKSLPFFPLQKSIRPTALFVYAENVHLVSIFSTLQLPLTVQYRSICVYAENRGVIEDVSDTFLYLINIEIKTSNKFKIELKIKHLKYKIWFESQNLRF